MFSRQLRWSQAFKDERNTELNVPFRRNTVSIPPNMQKGNEDQLALLRTEINQCYLKRNRNREGN